MQAAVLQSENDAGRLVGQAKRQSRPPWQLARAGDAKLLARWIGGDWVCARTQGRSLAGL